jgi:hypothetical protein
MIRSNVINILYRGGAKQEIVCLNPDEAASVWLQISEAMMQGLPVIVIEDTATAIAISAAEICSVSLGYAEQERARIEQVPQRERPRPQPVKLPERGTLIAN